MKNSPPSAFHHLRIEAFDPDRMRHAIAGGDFDHTFLENGSCSLDVRNCISPGLQLDVGRYSFPVLVRGQFPRGRLCIGMVRRMRVPTWINGYEVSRRNLQVYAEDTELLYRAGPDVKWCAVSIEREFLQRSALDRLGRPLELPESGVHNHLPDPATLDRLEQAIENHFSRIESHPGSESMGREMIAHACVDAISSADPELAETLRRRFHRRFEAIDRADRFLRGKIGDSYSSTELCRDLGMSERNLQLYFQEAVGMSPKQWFGRLALHRARAELLRRGPARGVVTEVALDCGFEHFGRFSKYYRELFGESPSRTGVDLIGISSPGGCA